MPSVLVLVCGMFWGYVFLRAFLFPATVFYPVFTNTQWMGNPGPKVAQSFFRKTLYLDGSPTNAWICLAGDNDYEVYVNGVKLGYDHHSDRNSYPFQAGLSETAQRVGNEPQFHNQNYPELQWDATLDWKLGTFFNLNNLLHPGKNVIAVWSETEGERARAMLQGAVEYADGRTLPLASDPSWRVSPLEPFQRGLSWFDPALDDLGWNHAVPMESTGEKLAVVSDPELYTSALRGRWMTGPDATSTQQFFRKTFVLSSRSREGWVRIATPQHYSLFVNGSFIGERTSTNFADMYDVTPFLDPGLNVIAVCLRPGEPTLNPSPPLRFALDGTFYGRGPNDPIQIQTDASWSASASVARNWDDKAGDGASWAPGALLGPLSTYDRSTLRRVLLPYSSLGARYYSKLALSLLAGSILTALVWFAAARWLGDRSASFPGRLRSAASCFLPALGVLAAVCLLEFRLSSSYSKVYFHGSALWFAVLLVTACLTVALLIRQRYPLTRGLQAGAVQRWRRFAHYVRQLDRHTLTLVALGLITVAGMVLRLWKLGYQGYHSDEFASMEASLGVISTGKPAYLTGILYTRSPLYHYLLALFLGVFGNSPGVARLPAAIFGIAIIPLSYKFCKDILGRPAVGLLLASLLAFNPWVLFVARNVRYYQQGQFVVLLTLYLFLRGFVQGNRYREQALAFAMFLISCLTMEVTVLLLPSFCLIYLFAGQRFSTRERLWHLGGLTALMVIILLDTTIFTVLCLTPFVGVGETCRSIIALHFSDLPFFATTFFAGDSRLNVIFSCLFFLGIPLWIVKRNRTLLVLVAFLLIAVIVNTLFVMQIATRYTYHLYTVLMLLAVVSAWDLFSTLADLSMLTIDLRARNLAKAGFVFLVIALFLSYEPDRILPSFHTRINRGDLASYAYVRAHMQPNDVVISTQPQGAVVGLGTGNQYFFSPRVSFDEIYNMNGTVADRWGGGQLVDNVDQLRATFANSSRAWIVESETPFRLVVQPELVNFLHENTRPMNQLFFSNVYLWDPQQGTFLTPKDNGRAGNPY